MRVDGFNCASTLGDQDRRREALQGWDDGVTADVRCTSLLSLHSARATFNFYAGLHQRERRFGWRQADTEVWRLGQGDLRELFDEAM